MPTTKQSCGALVHRVGFDPGRTKEAARALTEGGVLPSGAPGKSPELTPQHVATLMLGAALDVPLRAVADTVREYRELTPAGTPIDMLPASLQYSAGNYLDALANEPELARHLKIEVVSTWPGISIHSPDGIVRRFVEPGTHPNHWQHSGHMRSTTVIGSAFADAVTELFSKES
ncbi:hypothetical protein [Mesorhizobium sp. M0674]|uniref:hypothetical protein n=1 Tax=unclassified Mesorhizobium TaxID=325217 RepID=UPI00333D9419